MTEPTTTKQLKKFRFVAPDIDVFEEFPTTRGAIADAMVASYAGHTKLYRVLDDGTEELLYDSLKCKNMSIDSVLRWAKKSGKS